MQPTVHDESISNKMFFHFSLGHLIWCGERKTVSPFCHRSVVLWTGWLLLRCLQRWSATKNKNKKIECTCTAIDFILYTWDFLRISQYIQIDIFVYWQLHAFMWKKTNFLFFIVYSIIDSKNQTILMRIQFKLKVSTCNS